MFTPGKSMNTTIISNLMPMKELKFLLVKEADLFKLPIMMFITKAAS